MNDERVYIRIHKKNHTFDEFRVYEEDYNMTIGDFVEEVKEREG